MDKIAESAWGRFWIIFTNFGTTGACLIGIIIIIRGIKLIADTVIHGHALRRLFGWSLHLLGTFNQFNQFNSMVLRYQSTF